ncbi:MAG: tRNA epoxyqueuosine(34) reductase QueG [Sandarakinorhabdus limnophila]|nr:tRNA epoxyqueuosine(34) reductase QueG [Sandarakinorhabdus limnophila]MCM0032345.1 tRNA epoxyqueuosine(34) reductase QueG [Sandarakinorhabdus limnophila]
MIGRLKAEALRLGFADIGITTADAIPEAGARLKAWLADGCHGDMIWMPERADERASPKGLWPDVKSVIMLGTSYAPPLDPLRLAGQGDTGVISVYAWNRDYHDLIKKRLKALARWLVAEAGGELKVFVDTAPVMEKPLAAAAGLGWQGKHTNLVSRKHGSWLFLGAIYTTLDLAADAPHADRCGSCTRCQTACPTKAFPSPYRLDARRCLAYLTIEHKGPIPEEFRAPMANRIYGCDDCLAVCPWNRFAAATEEPAFLPRAALTAPKLAELLALDDAGFRALFSGSAIKRIGVNRFIRNCLYAAGNSGEAALIPAVQAHLGSEDLVVADAARWAMARLEAA